MNEAVTEFLTPVGPWSSATPSASGIFNIALAAASSTATDLTGANYVGLKAAIDRGSVIILTATVDIWYRWSTATGTVDEATTAASTPANQGVFLPAGSSRAERPPLPTSSTGYYWLLAKATPSAGTLVVQIGSKPENTNMGGAFA